jgi:hypothetical protein
MDITGKVVLITGGPRALVPALPDAWLPLAAKS